MKTIIEPVERVDIGTGKREKLFDLSMTEPITFRTKEQAEQAARVIEELAREEV